jgi:hypothetical protein
MGPIRQAINLVAALALTGCSAAVLLYLFLYATKFKIWMPVAAVIFLTVGLIWLWEDFVKPMLDKGNHPKGEKR